MKRINIIKLAAALVLLPAAAFATTQSSPNYTINAGRIVSGGTASTDTSGMSKTGITIGQGVFMPPGGSSSPSYSGKPVLLAAVAAAVPVQLSTLPDGATTSSSSLTVSGTVTGNPPPKALTVNGMPVTINPDGSFSITIPLTPGVNTITVSSTDQNGVVTTTTRTVIYNPSAPPVSVTSIANNSTSPLTQTTVPLSGNVGPNVTSVLVSVNGGAPQTVAVVNGAFSTTSGPLAAGMNTIVITTVSASGSSSSSAITVWRGTGASALVHNGDINGDGVVDIIDALLGLQAGIGLVQLTSSEISRGDVGPLVNNVAVGDGRIDIEDTILILRKAVGLAW